MKYIIDRLKEPSTWVGLIAIAGSFLALEITPEQSAAISTGLATIAGIVLAATRAHGSD